MNSDLTGEEQADEFEQLDYDIRLPLVEAEPTVLRRYSNGERYWYVLLDDEDASPIGVDSQKQGKVEERCVLCFAGWWF